MPISPANRRAQIARIQKQYAKYPAPDLFREYLSYEHAMISGIQPQHRTDLMAEMVEITYDALRTMLIKALGSAQRLEEMADNLRDKMLIKLHYANP
ncbi:MAG: hypothetical protein RLZZ324_352 [Candidatus Parcubacteria bacterium]|jgi:hypothetical protein